MFAKVAFVAVLAVFLFGSGVESVADDIRIRFYTGTNQWQLYTVHNVHTAFNHAAFNNNRQTTFYHYGFSQSETTDNVVEVIRAYNSNPDHNFFLIYYLSITTNTVTNTREIGDTLASAYIRLCDTGVPPARLHLVGFSLGAQVQAFASRTVQERTNRRIVVGRLTGVDPG